MKFTLANFRFSLSALAGALIFVACTGCDDPPEACFSPNATVVDVNVPATFANCSERATGYQWDFGDGSTSTEASPSHAFAAEGQYLVSMVAKAKVSANDDTYKTLVVAGQRLYASSQILSLPATNPSGGPWDPSDGPDIAVRFMQGANLGYQSGTTNNATFTFPLAVPNPAFTMVLSPLDWTVNVLDIDSGSEEVMATFTVNLASYVPGATKTISLNAANASMVINYTLR